MKQSDNNPVLLYKIQGKSDEIMSEDDFVLALQTPFLAHMLQSCGHDKIVLTQPMEQMHMTFL